MNLAQTENLISIKVGAKPNFCGDTSVFEISITIELYYLGVDWCLVGITLVNFSRDGLYYIVYTDLLESSSEKVIW